MFLAPVRAWGVLIQSLPREIHGHDSEAYLTGGFLPGSEQNQEKNQKQCNQCNLPAMLRNVRRAGPCQKMKKLTFLPASVKNLHIDVLEKRS